MSASGNSSTICCRLIPKPSWHRSSTEMNRYLEEALDLAQAGLGRVSPNPAVGAVVVRDGAVVGRGFYIARGVKHAEVIALEEAGAGARGATLYVKVEAPLFHRRRPA